MKLILFFAVLIPLTLILLLLILAAIYNPLHLKKESSLAQVLVTNTPQPTPRIKTNTPEYITEKFYTDYLKCLKELNPACNPNKFNQVDASQSSNVNRNSNKNMIICSVQGVPDSFSITRVVGTALTEAYVYVDEAFSHTEDKISLVVKTQKINNEWKIIEIICSS